MINLILGPILSLVDTVVNKIFPDANKSAELRAELTMAMLNFDWQAIQAQLSINLEEAKSEKWWKAGWRPAMGWTCVAAYAYHFVLQPFFIFGLSMLSIPVAGVPTLEISELGVILMGMLGLGGLRTFEKMKGVGGV